MIWGLFSSRFSVTDAQTTATILAFLCLGLAGWAAQSVISRGFYALGSTWLPTIVGTAIAFLLVPLYVELRHQMDAIGLAIASAIAILLYVLLLGWLQHRPIPTRGCSQGPHFNRCAQHAGRSATVGGGRSRRNRCRASWSRICLVRQMPGMQLSAILMRATVLCAVGVGVYLAVARALGVSELGEIAGVLLRELRLTRHVGCHDPRSSAEGESPGRASWE